MKNVKVKAKDFHSLRKNATGNPMSRESVVERKLREQGAKQELGDACQTFQKLYVEKDLSLDDIAKLLKVSRPSVTYAAKQMGFDISRRGRANLMLREVKKLGYATVAEYFRAKDKDAPTPFEEMARELGVCNATVEKHYAEFLREVSEKNKAAKA